MTQGIIVSPANRGVQVVVTDENNVQLLIDSNRGVNLEIVPQPRIEVLVDKGVEGAQGPVGPQGPQGPQGTAATVTAGTTTTGLAGTNAIVTNSGTSSAAVFDFTIPRGDTGLTGATGAGVAVGGTTGQVLVKASNVNYDTTWATITGTLVYQGSWNASTNTPTLTSSVGTNGYYYVVGTSGSTNLNGITDWVVGDWAIFNGTIWQKIDNTDLVSSVNGQTGVVVLTASSVGALAIANNLSDLADAPTARTNLGLGTAATQNSTAFATAAQGATADTALQTVTSADGSIVVLQTGTNIDLAVSAASPASTLLTQVRNTTGATLTKGTVVYISGATGQISTVSKAIASGDSTSAQTLGMITANLANNSNGYVTVFGLLQNMNTSAYTDGAQLYLSGTVAGEVTATKPSAPTHLVYVAVVEYAHPTQGKLLVKVQNGYELDEIHDVSIVSPTTGQTLVYSSVTDLWSNSNAPTITGGTINNTTIGATTPSTGVFTTLTATGQTSLGGVTDSESMRVLSPAATGTYIQVQSSSSILAEFRAIGSQANNSLRYVTRGTGNHVFATNNSGSTVQLQVSPTTSAVNYVQVTGAATGSFPTVSAQGSDANLSFFINAKGNGAVNVSAHRTNYLQLAGAGATLAPSILSQGSDTNIDLNLTPKGTGTVVANGPFTATGQTSLGGAAGSESLRVSSVSSAVNYIQINGAATGTSPSIQTFGSSNTQFLNLFGRGTGGGTNIGSGTTTQFAVRGVSGSATVNFLQANGSTTSTAPTLSAQGSDTNISQVFQSKGTGAIDLAAGSSGVNISNGGTVTAITTTANGTAYTSLPSVAISAPTTAGGVQATASISAMFTSTATVNSGGTGYTIGDVLTLVGGTVSGGGGVGRYTVASVSSGVITAVTRTQGNYLVLPTNPVSVTGGTGTDATLNLTWLFQSASITNAGSGYVEQPTVTFSGGGGSGAAAFARVGGTVSLTSLGSTLNLNTEAGTGFRVLTAGTTATDMWQAISNGNTAILRSSNATANGQVQTSGTGGVQLGTNSGVTQCLVSHTASAVNYVQVTGAATGSTPIISVQGSDAAITGAIQTKGGGSFSFYSQANLTGRQVRIDGSQNAVNYVDLYGSVSGNAISVRANGTDTNIDLNLTPKGTGTVVANGPFTATGQTSLGGVAGSESLRVLQPVAAAGLRLQAGVPSSTVVRLGPAGSAIADFRILAPTFTNFYTGSSSDGLNDGAAQMRVSHTASAVNYLQVTGAATGAGPTITAGGSDASVPLVLAPKGGTTTQFWTSGGRQFQVGHTASTVNYATVTGGATGSGPIFSVNGTDTNIDLALTPKGTGNVRFGTYTGTALSISGFIEIKDSGGTVRKLAVVA